LSNDEKIFLENSEQKNFFEFKKNFDEKKFFDEKKIKLK